MKKMLLVLAVAAMVAVGFSFPTAVVACDESDCPYETVIISSNSLAPPPMGKRTVKTEIQDGSPIQVGDIVFHVFYWGSEECNVKKAPGIQRWTREKGVPCKYNVMLPSEKAAEDCRFNRTKIFREFLEIYKYELDEMPLQKASVGYHAYINLQPAQLRDAGLDP